MAHPNNTVAIASHHKSNNATIDLTDDDSNDQASPLINLGGGFFMPYDYANIGGAALPEPCSATSRTSPSIFPTTTQL